MHGFFLTRDFKLYLVCSIVSARGGRARGLIWDLREEMNLHSYKLFKQKKGLGRGERQPSRRVCPVLGVQKLVMLHAIIQSLPASFTLAPTRPTVPAPVRGGPTTREEEDSASDSNESEEN